uniref:Uncharacterized protein n=1 Tax=Neobodo designis TaxID=312471 RepID=A0A6U4RA81_NEODS
MPSGAHDLVWTALLDECARRAGSGDRQESQLSLDVSAALLSRFVERRRPAGGYSDSELELLRDWTVACVNQLLELPPPEWQTREVKRIATAVRLMHGTETSLAQRLQRAADASLANRWNVKKTIHDALSPKPRADAAHP